MYKVAACVFASIFLFSSTSALAASFKLSPETFSLKASGNKSLTERVLLTNNSGENLNVKLSWSSSLSTEAAIDFASVNPSEIDLAPFSSQSIEIVLNLPEGIKAGDYFGDLLAKAEDEEALSHFELRVLGATNREIKLSSFEYKNGKLSINVTNSGNFVESGTLNVKTASWFDLFGQSKTEKIKLLPKQTKKVSFAVDLIPGFYHSTMTIDLDDKQQTKVFSFWSDPVIFFSVVFLLLVVSFVGFRKFLRR